MEKEKYIFQQIGFIRTLRILYDNNMEMLMKDFYIELNKESYYNAFFRVRKEMINLHLIEENGKIITLTNKGKQTYLTLKDLVNFTKNE